MTLENQLPLILTICITYLLLSGVVVLTWGRTLPRQGDWLVWSGLAAVFGSAAFAGNALVHAGAQNQIWYKGWIGPRSEVGAITVGILEDPLSIAMVLLLVVIGAVLMMTRSLVAEEPRRERFNAAVALAVSGCALAWISLSPWFAFIGMGLTIFGGFVALGSRWNQKNEDSLASRFGSERTWGLLLAILGMCGIAGTRGALIWTSETAWAPIAGSAGADSLAAGILLVGLFIQFQPFPFLSWSVTPSRCPAQMRSGLAQLFPGLAAFAILIRLQPHFASIGASTGLGWFLVFSAFLAMSAGFLQKDWRRALSLAMSTGFSLSAAILMLGEPLSAFQIILGCVLGILVLGIAGESLDDSTPEPASLLGGARVGWVKAEVFCAAAVATGIAGFVSAGGTTRWLARIWDQPGEIAIFLFSFFLFITLGWKLAWMVTQGKQKIRGGWNLVVVFWIPILLAMGWIWNGSISGALLSPEGDRVLPSFLDGYFSLLSGTVSRVAIEGAILSAAGTYWGVMVVAVGGAYWLSRQAPGLVPSGEGTVARFADFVRTGYGVESFSRRALRFFSRIGKTLVWLVDIKLWNEWIPRVLVNGSLRSATAIARMDGRILSCLRELLRRWIDVPAKVLQLIQNGDVQWYLFFAVGAGLAILVHFLRN